jgi:hypothetical protein
VHLIDTPGFDDTNRSDSDVLIDIANWLASSYKREERLGGILFLHPISATRLSGGARRNLDMFKKLCGKGCFPSVTLATTHWDEVRPEVGGAREQQLQTTDGMWLDMIQSGSHYMRHNGKKESSLEILEYMITHRRDFTAAIQYEMVENGLSLQETEAGQKLACDLLAAQEQHHQEVKALQIQYEEARKRQDYETQQQLRQMQNETNLQIEEEKKARAELAVNLNTIKRQKQEEMRRYQAETAKQIAEISKMKAAGKKSKEEMQAQVKGLEEKIISLGRKQSARGGEHSEYSFRDTKMTQTLTPFQRT